MIKSINEVIKAKNIVVIIPAFNEQDAIGKVIRDIPKNIVNEIIVVDNGSTDATSQIASELGAKVIFEPKKGYGFACLAGMKNISIQKQKPDIIAFMDGDYSDYPEELVNLLSIIITKDYDMVVGSRMLGKMGKNAMTTHSLLANKVISRLLTFLLKEKITDLGPFRVIKYNALVSLNMNEKKYGWTVEMIIKAVRNGLKTREIPVRYRERLGSSKISGNKLASIKAIIVIFYSISKYMAVHKNKF
jgi:glycosyltransferase involved in cell wall biosynthesis